MRYRYDHAPPHPFVSSLWYGATNAVIATTRATLSFVDPLTSLRSG
jgi:hypothetical protein